MGKLGLAFGDLILYALAARQGGGQGVHYRDSAPASFGAEQGTAGKEIIG
jgi:hypothetical protein